MSHSGDLTGDSPPEPTSDGQELDAPADDPLASWHDESPNDSPLREGAILLNRFRLLHRFEGSGQSAVWAAWEVAVRRFVVLKFVHARLLEEAQRAANVPGAVIGVYEYNDTAIPENPFLVLEFAPGGPIGRLADVWAAKPALLIEKIIPVVRTLVAAHAGGTVHRDLKPNNLLLWAELPPAPRDGSTPPLPAPSSFDLRALSVKLADWGLATGDGDAGSGYGGTPGFAAPEQWGRPATPAADVFGMAATLYFLLTGQYAVPATRTFAARLLSGAETYTPPPPVHELNPRIDARLSRIIMTSLAAAPAERHPSADALAGDLERWLNGSAIPGDGRACRARLWLRRNRAWVPTATAAGVLLALLTIVAVVTTLSNARNRADADAARADAADAARRAAEARSQQSAETASHMLALSALQKRNAARRFAADGNWSEAVPAFDELIGASAEHDAVRLRVDRLAGLLATNDIGRFCAELDALSRRPGLTEHDTAVLCAYRAERFSWDPRTAEHAAAEARQAEALFAAARPSGEEPVGRQALRAHAATMVVRKPLDRLAALRRVANDHPFFFPARRNLLLTLAACGKLDEAEAELRWFRVHFPKSPAAEFAAAVVAILRTPTAPGVSEPAVAPRTLVAVREGVREIAQLPHPFEHGLDKGHLFLKRGAERAAAQARVGLAAASAEFPNLGLPSAAIEPLTAVFAAFGPYRTAMELQKEGIAAAEAELARAAEEYPDGTILILRAVVRMTAGAVTHQRAPTVEEVRAFALPATWLDEGCRTATVLPSPGLLYFFHVLGASAAIMPVRFDPEDPAGYVARLESLLARMRQLGRTVPAHRKLHANAFFQAYTMSVEQTLEAKVWRLDTKEGAERLAERKRRIVHAVTGLLHDWIDHEPRAPEPWFELARMGEWAGYPKAWIAQQLDAVEARDPGFYGLRAARARVKAGEPAAEPAPKK